MENENTLKPHEQRVIEEKRDLSEKIVKLNSFTDGENFGGLPRSQRESLRKQLDIMRQYEQVLHERICLFSTPK